MSDNDAKVEKGLSRAYINWAGWIIGCGLIITAIYMHFGTPVALGTAGVWVIITGFGYHSIGIIRGLEAHIEPDDESDIHDERWKNVK